MQAFPVVCVPAIICHNAVFSPHVCFISVTPSGLAMPLSGYAGGDVDRPELCLLYAFMGMADVCPQLFRCGEAEYIPVFHALILCRARLMVFIRPARLQGLAAGL